MRYIEDPDYYEIPETGSPLMAKELKTMEKPETKTCECGNTFVPKGAGIHKTKCPSCVSDALAQAQASRQKNRSQKEEREYSPAADHSWVKIDNGPSDPVQIIFGDHEELYKWFCKKADEDFRTPKNEILYLVSKLKENEAKAA